MKRAILASVLVGVTAVIALSLPHAQQAWASPLVLGSGTRTVQNFTVTSIREVDGNTFITGTETGVFAGTVSGMFRAPLAIVIHPDGTENFRGTNICICTVEGVTGPYQDLFEGSGVAGGAFAGHVVFGGTGSLANLRGEGTFQGSGAFLTYAVKLQLGP
jgi:hypothetical protein